MIDLFQSTTIPLLKQVVSFTQARHTVLAGNIANCSTPGYVARDLSVADFQAKLKQAAAATDAPTAETFTGAWESGEATTKAAENYPTILAHDQSQVNLETQVSEMVKNRLQHNMAVSILSNQMQLLRAAISEQA
jgi:flagellar basal-body rod protein FlgB